MNVDQAEQDSKDNRHASAHAVHFLSLLQAIPDHAYQLSRPTVLSNMKASKLIY